MAGYSGTPLVTKLGIKPDHRVVVIHAPEGFTLEGVPAATRLAKSARADVVVAFFTERAALAKELPKIAGALAKNGGLWIAWPKKASKRPTDITEDAVREVAFAASSHELVDNKVCAIDDVWSGLRLVYRLTAR